MKNKKTVCFGGLRNWLATAVVLIGARPAMASEEVPSFYSLKAKSIEGAEVALSKYTGQVVMVVNVASRCGFTKQYADLEELYLKYKDRGFVILGFPSNDFGGQEPGSDTEIKKFCSLNFNVTFPMFTKGHVKGDGIQPVFKYLTVDAGTGVGGSVLWNFEKFLINKKGRIVERYRSITRPTDKKVIKQIEKLLNEKP